MPRVARKIECSEEDQRELHRIVGARSGEARMVERAKLILGLASGKRVKDVAKDVGVVPQTVIFWRKRYESGGIGGLVEHHRSGRPVVHGPALRDKVLETLEKPPPKGQACWDGKAVAERLKVSSHAVWRVMRKEGICLQRHRSWCVSTDPEFAVKAADIVGLYLDPPENALVLAVDEKPNIQALERAVGYVHTSSGKIARGYQSTYERHGTLDLFAALHVATGKIDARITTRKTKVEFLAFMDQLVADHPKDLEIHVILDNLSTHKRNDDWLAAHPNVHFHFTPTSASWLNMVEIWFGIFSRKALKGASFKSCEELRTAIEEFLAAYAPGAEPFVWRKREVRGSQLRNTVANLRN